MGKASATGKLRFVRLPLKDPAGHGASGSNGSDPFFREWVLMGSYLVDPASSHMLVSKIKPCMSKYKLLYCETANGSLNQL